jgi:hypothetical protein
MCMGIDMYMHMGMCTQPRLWCAFACKHVYVHAYACVNGYTHAYVCLDVNVCVYVCNCLCVCMCYGTVYAMGMGTSFWMSIHAWMYADA